ncbi:MAG TPA: hypothetical protein VNC50_19435 [Planctomycetia bacterium]|nr:hypothetical protein [Planctomycetia bacterium]
MSLGTPRPGKQRFRCPQCRSLLEVMVEAPPPPRERPEQKIYYPKPMPYKVGGDRHFIKGQDIDRSMPVVELPRTRLVRRRDYSFFTSAVALGGTLVLLLLVVLALPRLIDPAGVMAFWNKVKPRSGLAKFVPPDPDFVDYRNTAELMKTRLGERVRGAAGVVEGVPVADAESEHFACQDAAGRLAANRWLSGVAAPKADGPLYETYKGFELRTADTVTTLAPSGSLRLAGDERAVRRAIDGEQFNKDPGPYGPGGFLVYTTVKRTFWAEKLPEWTSPLANLAAGLRRDGERYWIEVALVTQDKNFLATAVQRIEEARGFGRRLATSPALAPRAGSATAGLLQACLGAGIALGDDRMTVTFDVGPTEVEAIVASPGGLRLLLEDLFSTGRTFGASAGLKWTPYAPPAGGFAGGGGGLITGGNPGGGAAASAPQAGAGAGANAGGGAAPTTGGGNSGATTAVRQHPRGGMPANFRVPAGLMENLDLAFAQMTQSLGRERVAVIIADGFAETADQERIQKRINEIAAEYGAFDGHRSWAESSDLSVVGVLGPVKSLDELASKIDFGKVIAIEEEKRRIYVGPK